MSKPSNFDEAAYQKRIDALVGTRDGRPLIKLAWAPDEFRWYPHRLGSDPLGYAFPSFCNSRDKDGELHSPDRWGLWARNEPEQYAPLWEATRYVKHKGQVWDVKGPCPSEKYIELRLHAFHDADCCPCHGHECACDDHCWGKYAEPNEFLFNWIRQSAWEAVHDPDVQPMEDIRFFNAPQAQQQVASDTKAAEQKTKVAEEDFNHRMVKEWLKHSAGLKQTPSGLYLVDN